VEWTVYDKVKKITRKPGSSKPNLVFTYDSKQMRLTKTEEYPSDPNSNRTTYYVYDASGMLMATYTKKFSTALNGFEYLLEEEEMYGLSRLGSYKANASITALTGTGLGTGGFTTGGGVLTGGLGNAAGIAAPATDNTVVGTSAARWSSNFATSAARTTADPATSAVTTEEAAVPPLPGTSLLTIDRSLTETDLSTGTTTTGTGTTGTTGGLLTTFLSKLRFEITDHLGNVRAVVTGQKKADNSATIVALTDYHEFGSPIGDRSYTLEAYRYGYQGSENDKELWGGAGINTEYRMLDPRIGRWFSPDPITQPYQSPYTSMDNNPIALTDILGLVSGKGPMGHYETRAGIDGTKDVWVPNKGSNMEGVNLHSFFTSGGIENLVKSPTSTGLKNLFTFSPPYSTLKTVRENHGSIQKIENGVGDVNIDYYAVQIYELPYIRGHQMSSAELFQFIRKNLGEFLDKDIAELLPFSEADAKKWNSQNPMNAIMTFNIGGESWNPFKNVDDAAVVVSDATELDWIFTTININGDGSHPVNGHRQFGFKNNPNGTFTFYIKGLDRANSDLEKMVGDYPFTQADKLWRSVQKNVVNWVNRQGGRAAPDKACTWVRVPWDQVKDKIKR
jgi:RHS repeat-associated protein